MLNQPRKFIFTLVDQPKYGTAYIDGNTLILLQKKILLEMLVLDIMLKLFVTESLA